MIAIDDNFVLENIQFPELILALKLAFKNQKIQSPPKSNYEYSGSKNTLKNTLLIMPSWDNENYVGIKIITATPNNSKTQLPYLQGIYMIFDAQTGTPLYSLDAKLITNLRTAATSALAANYLAKKDAKTLLVLGNGNLSSYFIEAHLSVRNYSKIYLWGRSIEKSKGVEKILNFKNIAVEVIDDYKNIINKADVVSCITASELPLFHLKDISTGQHIDLAGSFTPQMQEVSADVMQNCTIYTDNLDSTPNNAGEIIEALKNNLIQLSDIKDLSFLCSNEDNKRNSETENTLFKSTGMALEDLVIATLIVNKFKNKMMNKYGKI